MASKSPAPAKPAKVFHVLLNNCAELRIKAKSYKSGDKQYTCTDDNKDVVAEVVRSEVSAIISADAYEGCICTQSGCGPECG
jgi:hypothetical protein